jgi:hypothetical protein
MTIIRIALGNDKTYNLSFIIDYNMKFETKEGNSLSLRLQT